MWYKHVFQRLSDSRLSSQNEKKQNSLKKKKVFGGECNEAHLS